MQNEIAYAPCRASESFQIELQTVNITSVARVLHGRDNKILGYDELERWK